MHADCTFANLGGDGLVVARGEEGCADCSAAVNANNVSVTIVNSTFFDPVALPGSSYVRAWEDSRVAISGCEFAPTPQLDAVPFYTADRSTIYSDRSGLVTRSGEDGVQMGAPLQSAVLADLGPTERLLQRSDPWFANITAVRPHPCAFPPLQLSVVRIHAWKISMHAHGSPTCTKPPCPPPHPSPRLPVAGCTHASD